MARSMREARYEAIYGPGWSVISEYGGRKANHAYGEQQVEQNFKKALLKKLKQEGSYYASPTRTNAHSDEPSMERHGVDQMSHYQAGSLPDWYDFGVQWLTKRLLPEGRAE